jgi:hypothetical protein
MGPDATLSLVLLLGPASLGLVLAMLMPQMPHEAPFGLAVTIATLYGFGFVLFTVARISDQRAVSAPVTPRRMAPEYLRLYRMGYAMMSTALFLMLVYIKVTR